MINIQDIIPFMKKGWVAMDENGLWCWFETKPIKVSSITGGYWQSNACECAEKMTFIIKSISTIQGKHTNLQYDGDVYVYAIELGERIR